jgi:hypothetical protein
MNIWKWLSNKLKEQDKPDFEDLFENKTESQLVSLTSKVDEMKKRIEDQAKEIEGLRIDLKGLEERTDKEIQFCLEDIKVLSKYIPMNEEEAKAHNYYSRLQPICLEDIKQQAAKIKGLEEHVYGIIEE